jgi:hypothetical protein
MEFPLGGWGCLLNGTRQGSFYAAFFLFVAYLKYSSTVLSFNESRSLVEHLPYRFVCHDRICEWEGLTAYRHSQTRTLIAIPSDWPSLERCYYMRYRCVVSNINAVCIPVFDELRPLHHRWMY